MASTNTSLMKSERNVALDVLRCVLMFGVVLQHVVPFCHRGDTALSRSLIVLMTLTFPCVDGFTAISGWFGVRCSFKKLVKLGALIAYCGTLSFVLYWLCHCFLGELYLSKFGVVISKPHFSLGVFRYWYLGAYIKLMLLTILLNPLLEKIGNLSKRWILLLFFVFVVASYLSIYIIPWGSHTPRTVIFVYLVVRFLMLLDIKSLLDRFAWTRHVARILLLALYGIFIWFAIFSDSECFHNYHNPLTILAGVLLLLVAYSIPLRGDTKLAKFCVYIAPSMVSVYMLNITLFVSAFKPIPDALSTTVPFLSLPASYFIIAIVVFFLCTALDLLRHKFIKALSYPMTRIYDKICAILNFSNTRI